MLFFWLEKHVTTSRDMLFFWLEKHVTTSRDTFSGADTNTKAVVEFCSTTADLSVPNLRSKGAHASPSLLAHAAGRRS